MALSVDPRGPGPWVPSRFPIILALVPRARGRTDRLVRSGCAMTCLLPYPPRALLLLLAVFAFLPSAGTQKRPPGQASPERASGLSNAPTIVPEVGGGYVEASLASLNPLGGSTASPTPPAVSRGCREERGQGFLLCLRQLLSVGTGVVAAIGTAPGGPACRPDHLGPGPPWGAARPRGGVEFTDPAAGRQALHQVVLAEFLLRAGRPEPARHRP